MQITLFDFLNACQASFSNTCRAKKRTRRMYARCNNASYASKRFFLLTRFVFSSLPPHIVHFSSIRSYISEILSTPYAGCYYCCWWLWHLCVLLFMSHLRHNAFFQKSFAEYFQWAIKRIPKEKNEHNSSTHVVCIVD